MDIDDLTVEQLHAELQRGGRFVLFEYCISIILMTFRRSTGVRFIPAGEGTFFKALPYILISLLFGWWGFPFGFIYTPAAIYTNLTGGRDVTAQMMAALSEGMEAEAAMATEMTAAQAMAGGAAEATAPEGMVAGGGSNAAAASPAAAGAAPTGATTAPTTVACPSCDTKLKIANPTRPLNVACPDCETTLVLR